MIWSIPVRACEELNVTLSNPKPLYDIEKRQDLEKNNLKKNQEVNNRRETATFRIYNLLPNEYIKMLTRDSINYQGILLVQNDQRVVIHTEIYAGSADLACREGMLRNVT